MKAPAELVAHPPVCHRAQRGKRHLALPVAQQELQHGGLRELRGTAEAAVDGVEGLPQPYHRGVERARVEGLRGGLQARAAGQLRADPLAPRRISAACSRHVSAIAWSTCVHDGIPWRGSGGKYVPP